MSTRWQLEVAERTRKKKKHEACASCPLKFPRLWRFPTTYGRTSHDVAAYACLAHSARFHRVHRLYKPLVRTSCIQIRSAHRYPRERTWHSDSARPTRYSLGARLLCRWPSLHCVLRRRNAVLCFELLKDQKKSLLSLLAMATATTAIPRMAARYIPFPLAHTPWSECRTLQIGLFANASLCNCLEANNTIDPRL